MKDRHSTYHSCWLSSTPENVPGSPREAAELELNALGISYRINVTDGGDSFTIGKDGGVYTVF